MLVPQLYCTDTKSDYWAWPAATGNNRSKARLQLLEVGLSELVCGVADVAGWLADWAGKRNAELAHNQDTAIENSARRGLMVAVVETLLVVGTPTPHLLFDIVQAQNVPEHVYPPEPYDALSRYRTLGKSDMRAYRLKRADRSR